jgi:hypothetical protein
MYAYEQHPLSKAFPPMAKDAFRNLCDDIAADGLQFAIILFEGMILDGWHRYLACKELGIEPEFKEFGGDLAAARKYVISANHHRRNAKRAQIAMTAADLQPARMVGTVEPRKSKKLLLNP